MTQPNFSRGSRCIGRHGVAPWLGLLVAAAALQLMACGGSEAPAVVLSGERAQAMAQAPAAAAPPIETAAHGCVRQVNQALKANAPKVNADCLAGTYSGVDIRGKACTLHMAASQGRFRFVESDKMLSVEVDAAGSAAKPPVYAIERSADVEMGQVGLQLSRRSAEQPGDVETLVLVAGETSKGPLDLASASFSRVKAGGSTIVRCFFDT